MRREEAVDGEELEVDSAHRDPMSSGLLINVIRTLTSSISDDQRELERSRLEKGYVESGLVIDRLLKEHQTDVKQCLTSFRRLSNDITASRERIRNVKNALHTCKSLLQCQRDGLKKLWMESAEQNRLTAILQQIYDIKHIDKTIEGFVEVGDYRSAVDVLKKADILLNGPLSQIDGLNQLRTNIHENTQSLFEKIVQNILHCVVIVPFDCQVMELMKGLSEKQVDELPPCVALLEKYSTRLRDSLPPTYATMVELWASRANAAMAVPLVPNTASVVEQRVRNKMAECLEALMVFDQLDAAIMSALSQTSSQCKRALNDAITIMRSLIKDSVGDATNFAQLCQLLIKQINDSAFRFHIVLEELQKIRNEPIVHLRVRFWDVMQEVLEAVVSDHLEVWRSDGKKQKENWRRNTKTLFSFDNTSFAVTANSSLLKKHCNLICPATSYNVVPVFQYLNRFATTVEKELGEDSICKFSAYLRVSAIEAFIERVCTDLDAKSERILNDADVWTSVSHNPAYDMKILTSCLRIFELCETINDFILKISVYTQRFAALWLLVVTKYARHAAEAASSQVNNGVLHESLQWFVERMRHMIDTLPEASYKLLQSRRVQIKSADGGEIVEQLLCEALEERFGELENL